MIQPCLLSNGYHSVAEAPTPPVTQRRAAGGIRSSGADFADAAAAASDVPRPVPAPRAPRRRPRPSREAFRDVAVAFGAARSEADDAAEDDDAKNEVTATASFAKGTPTQV